jgi:glycine/D-amino acid oxidase-like deaminating enzyme
MSILNKNINYSYWELKQYFTEFDLIVVGAGIVGLSSAISYKNKNKKAKILILERGVLPNGASTKNAGFACFGSSSELLDDLSKNNSETIWETVLMRWQGLQILRKRLGDKGINLNLWGGYELFDSKENKIKSLEKIKDLNKEIYHHLGIKNCFSEYPKNNFGFKNTKGIILNKYEGQIDTGLMMQNLLLLAQKKGITVLNNIEIKAINDLGGKVELKSINGVFKAKKVVVATNGFANELLKINNIKPARAQVLITKPISQLKIKGTFHYQEGYYYFRNIKNRLLFGGGRNINFKKEETSEIGLNSKIQNHLEYLLKTMILPNTAFEIEHRWSGIMGVGNEKKPIIKPISNNVIAAVRMGGMGVALSAWASEKLVNLM